ncbi:MAG: NADH:ubiquinone reductase (Na(+)-transporting) subunit C [Chlamydiia bacterium]|nr:NADH:ubiquinone reductase (Na(+)-transporting) subunit C [Chlamydiia bacterium]
MGNGNTTFSNQRIFLFILILCSLCALILSLLTLGLTSKQKRAEELYRSRQLLLAASLINYDGELLPSGTGKATSEEILVLFKERIRPYLTDAQGKLYTFEALNIDEEIYLKENEKLGYAQLPYKLLFIVLDREGSERPYGYVIPVNGYGLWDAIYGYLGVKGDGDTVLGMTWYQQKETPGLGGEIALPEWQKQFLGKELFRKNSEGKTLIKQAALRIQVVKTTVKETYGNSPLGDSAVDGIPGASITVMGVNEALRTSLAPYRPFLERAYKNEVILP